MPNQKQLQRAFRDHIIAQNPQMMISFNYVRQVTYDQMQAHIASTSPTGCSGASSDAGG